MAAAAQIGRSIILVTKVLKESQETMTELAQFHGNKTITIPIDLDRTDNVAIDTK